MVGLLSIRLAVCVLCLFPTVPWLGLRSVIVAFSGQTCLLCSSACIQNLPHLPLSVHFTFSQERTNHVINISFQFGVLTHDKVW